MKRSTPSAKYALALFVHSLFSLFTLSDLTVRRSCLRLLCLNTHVGSSAQIEHYALFLLTADLTFPFTLKLTSALTGHSKQILPYKDRVHSLWPADTFNNSCDNCGAETLSPQEALGEVSLSVCLCGVRLNVMDWRGRSRRAKISLKSRLLNYQYRYGVFCKAGHLVMNIMVSKNLAWKQAN